MKRYSILLILGLILILTPNLSRAEEGMCISCHGGKDLETTDAAGKAVSLYVNPEVFGNSVHSSFTCVDCHAGVKDEFHEEKPGKVDCGLCHEDALSEYKESFHAKKYNEGVKEAPWCKDCHGYHDIKPSDDPESGTDRLNIPRMCARCHSNPVMREKHYKEDNDPCSLYEESIHWKETKEGNFSAVCIDCHPAHSLKESKDPASLTYRYNIPSTCGTCHSDVQDIFSESIHGKGVGVKNPEAPVCTDCHAKHSIQPSSVKTSMVYPSNVSSITCPWCHSTETLTDKYGVVTRKVTKYLDNYHGADSRAGRTDVASCASCHNSHDIRPPGDPQSSVNSANLPQTCGKCHPGAGKNYATAKIHTARTPQIDKGSYFIRRIYTILIILVIGGMLLHNSLIILKAVRERFREAKEGRVVRFNLSEIIQHILLMTTFTTLVVTGFAFRYPDAWWSNWLMSSEFGAHLRATIHRVAAVIFILTCIYNLYYMLFTRRGKAQLRAIFPTPDDMALVIQNINHFLGLQKAPPRFDRYAYMEKAEYWALIWGAIVMIVTGFPLWFEDFFLKFMPTWLLNVFKAVHFYEALLASTAIVVWHFFFVFLEPDTYPVNFSMLTGRITEKEFEEKHTAEYDRLKNREHIPSDTEEKTENNSNNS